MDKEGTKLPELFVVAVAFHYGGNVFVDGSGYIESLSIELSAEDKGNIAISISGCGTLQFRDGEETTTLPQDPPYIPNGNKKPCGCDYEVDCDCNDKAYNCEDKDNCTCDNDEYCDECDEKKEYCTCEKGNV